MKWKYFYTFFEQLEAVKTEPFQCPHTKMELRNEMQSSPIFISSDEHEEHDVPEIVSV